MDTNEQIQSLSAVLYDCVNLGNQKNPIYVRWQDIQPKPQDNPNKKGNSTEPFSSGTSEKSPFVAEPSDTSRGHEKETENSPATVK